jgi:alkaline phosphatase D
MKFHHPLFLAMLVLQAWSPSKANAQSEASFKIAFGSCSEEKNPDQMWGEILLQKPNLWMWIGDNIYGDSHNMDTLRAGYNRQKGHPDYQKMMKAFPIIGTWDDHDYGVNDGGKFYSKKKESKEELLNFLDVPADAEVRKHEGVYQSFVYGKGKQKIKIILLDQRTFRDTLISSGGKNNRYVENKEGDVLGEAQWTWLEKELRKSDASLHIIASSYQFLSNEHEFEKWGNLPKARQRMLDLLVKLRPTNTIFVSGDRHIAEISKLKLPGLDYPLYDFTSSGLTHTWRDVRPEKNSLRVGELIIQKNYGLINVEWKKKGPVVTMQARGKGNIVFAEEVVDFGSLTGF